MIEITLDSCNGNQQKMLSKFNKKVKESKLVSELKNRKFFASKKEKNKKKIKKSIHKYRMNKLKDSLDKI